MMGEAIFLWRPRLGVLGLSVWLLWRSLAFVVFRWCFWRSLHTLAGLVCITLRRRKSSTVMQPHGLKDTT